MKLAWRHIAAAQINGRAGISVKLDLATGRVFYDGSKIKLHREIKDVTGPEEVARAFLIHRLTNELGYKPELIEIEREYEAGRPKRITPILSSGKEHPRITLDILDRLEIPWLPIARQDEVLAELDPLLDRANELMAGVDRIDAPLNRYFEDRFGLKVALIDSNIETKCIDVSLTRIAQSRDARFSFRYLSPSVEIARKELTALSTRRLRELLIEPAVLGDSVSPENYEIGTGLHYISMVALKRWRVETDGLNEVSEEYFEDHATKRIQRGDVLMARSGEGTIGKVGLVRSAITGICADFVIRIRADANLLRPAFLHYCLMSRYYQQLIYGEKKGLGNNTNIFPNQIHEFPMIDLPPREQDSMVEDLDRLVSKYDSDIAEAHNLHNQIDERLTARLSE